MGSSKGKQFASTSERTIQVALSTYEYASFLCS